MAIFPKNPWDLGLALSKRRESKGFTLIELLVVIAIIGILGGGVVMMNIRGSQSRARDSKRRADLGSIKNALQMYYQENQQFPPDQVGCSVASYDSCPTSVLEDPLTPEYLSELPSDPRNRQPYYYNLSVGSGGQYYTLCAQMENENMGNDFVGQSGAGNCDVLPELDPSSPLYTGRFPYGTGQ